jgi:threonine/homoserine/homoserine lactone efflux protein
VEVFTNIWVFFASTILISLTGVMTPGPVFAAAVIKGYKDERAGIKIALGHGLVEFPLMALIIVSLGYIFENDMVKLGIGLIGGTLLLFLGASMIRSRKVVAEEGNELLPYDSIVAGALTTASNPYFLLWWATVGAVLVLNAQYFGPIIVVVFAVVHWSCDLAWYTFTSVLVFRTKHLWTPRVQELIFGTCGALMMVFGAYFLIGPALELAS